MQSDRHGFRLFIEKTFIEGVRWAPAVNNEHYYKSDDVVKTVTVHQSRVYTEYSYIVHRL